MNRFTQAALSFAFGLCVVNANAQSGENGATPDTRSLGKGQANFLAAPTVYATEGANFQIIASGGKEIVGVERNLPPIPALGAGTFKGRQVSALGVQSYESMSQIALEATSLNCPTSTCFAIRRYDDEGISYLTLTPESIFLGNAPEDEIRLRDGTKSRSFPAGTPAWQQVIGGKTTVAALSQTTPLLLLQAHPTIDKKYVIREYKNGALTDRALYNSDPSNLIVSYGTIVKNRFWTSYYMLPFNEASSYNQFTLRKPLGLLATSSYYLPNEPFTDIQYLLKASKLGAYDVAGLSFAFSNAPIVSANGYQPAFLGMLANNLEQVHIGNRKYPWSTSGLRSSFIFAIENSNGVAGCPSDMEGIAFPTGLSEEVENWLVCRMTGVFDDPKGYSLLVKQDKNAPREWHVSATRMSDSKTVPFGKITFAETMHIYNGAIASLGQMRSVSCDALDAASFEFGDVYTSDGVFAAIGTVPDAQHACKGVAVAECGSNSCELGVNTDK